jgi:hypothetical protein
MIPKKIGLVSILCTWVTLYVSAGIAGYLELSKCYKEGGQCVLGRQAFNYQ